MLDWTTARKVLSPAVQISTSSSSWQVVAERFAQFAVWEQIRNTRLFRISFKIIIWAVRIMVFVC